MCKHFHFFPSSPQYLAKLDQNLFFSKFLIYQKFPRLSKDCWKLSSFQFLSKWQQHCWQGYHFTEKPLWGFLGLLSEGQTHQQKGYSQGSAPLRSSAPAETPRNLGRFPLEVCLGFNKISLNPYCAKCSISGSMKKISLALLVFPIQFSGPYFLFLLPLCPRSKISCCIQQL